MIRNRQQKPQSICKQPLEWWIYATPFNSYTRKFGFDRVSAQNRRQKVFNWGALRFFRGAWTQKLYL